eukprot:TRINITY_DN3334_c0_g1_i1.p5 TRINITY_DN3334_c0_g1~~TRINITY_DN3334_c0_g1_i1.p5  ORF type:complete len:109 (+),score=22.33 TRINITY_DN3334_c0_g1_i1:1139-1465(+)
MSSAASASRRTAADTDSGYWSYAYRTVERKDIGHKCKECKAPFGKLGEPMAVRRGGRIELKYHQACFSGEADPRSQNGSSYASGRWDKRLSHEAPAGQYRKMRTGTHW